MKYIIPPIAATAQPIRAPAAIGTTIMPPSTIKTFPLNKVRDSIKRGVMNTVPVIPAPEMIGPETFEKVVLT